MIITKVVIVFSSSAKGFSTYFVHMPAAFFCLLSLSLSSAGWLSLSVFDFSSSFSFISCPFAFLLWLAFTFPFFVSPPPPHATNSHTSSFVFLLRSRVFSCFELYRVCVCRAGKFAWFRSFCRHSSRFLMSIVYFFVSWFKFLFST